jgi:hypothetical protein
MVKLEKSITILVPPLIPFKISKMWLTPESKKLIFLGQKVEGISMGASLGAKFD